MQLPWRKEAMGRKELDLLMGELRSCIVVVGEKILAIVWAQSEGIGVRSRAT